MDISTSAHMVYAGHQFPQANHDHVSKARHIHGRVPVAASHCLGFQYSKSRAGNLQSICLSTGIPGTAAQTSASEIAQNSNELLGSLLLH